MSEISEIKELLVGLHSKIDGLEEKMDSKFNEVYKKIDDVEIFLHKEINTSLKIALQQQEDTESQLMAISEDAHNKTMAYRKQILSEQEYNGELGTRIKSLTEKVSKLELAS